MTPYFFSRTVSHRELLQRLHTRPRLLAFDFDGTLSEFAPTPAQAFLPKRTQRLLQELTASPETTVALISGRELQTLKDKVKLPGIIYFGSHGLTSSRRGLGAPAEQMRTWRCTAQKAETILRALAAPYPGSLVENKGADLSLHYRRVASEKIPALLAQARSRMSEFPLFINPGNMVLEFRPPEAPDKGTALRQLAEHVAPGWKKNGVCLYMGDDSNDEDAFAYLRTQGSHALSFKVGTGRTQAKYRMRTVKEAETFLTLLLP